MAIKAANNPVTPFWHTYVPKKLTDQLDNAQGPEDVDEETMLEALPEGTPVTRFKLRGLRSIELFDVNAGSEVSADKKVRWSSRSIRTALSVALLGWENLPDDEGVPVEFSKNMEENFDRLDYLMLIDLFGAVMNASNISVDQRKN